MLLIRCPCRKGIGGHRVDYPANPDLANLVSTRLAGLCQPHLTIASDACDIQNGTPWVTAASDCIRLGVD
jgi:hypothetical protein